MTSPLASVRLIWEDHGGGAAWLTAAIAVTFFLGLGLQLLGLRSLNNGDYSTFVLALGIGNAANALAVAIQPVVAVRASSRQPAFLPGPLRSVLLVTTVATGVTVVLLAGSIGPLGATLVMLQIPLHAVVGVGLGRLQAARSFRRVAASLGIWSLARITIVLPFVAGGAESANIFLAALPGALLVEIAVLARLGAYRQVTLAPARDGGHLLRAYAFWLLFAWLLNQDVVWARLFLSPSDADSYALAFTLGRQPVYAVAPLVNVLLPVTLASASLRLQRRRLWAILLVSTLLLAASFAVFGVAPAPIARLLTGDAASFDATLIRGYVAVGALTAAATLLTTQLFGLGATPRLRVLLIPTALSALAAPVAAGTSALSLLAVQGLIIAALVALFSVQGFKATSARESASPLRRAA